MTVPLKNLPREERPRERLLSEGPERLSNAELIAILLRTGIRDRSAVELAQDVLYYCEQRFPGHPLGHLLRIRQDELKQVAKGIGDAKVCQLLAALQLGQRAQNVRPQRVDLSNPRAVFEYLSPLMRSLEREEFQVILLNAKNGVIGVECISRGTLTASLVHPREVFKIAIRHSAHAIILAHNHPSGDPTPSREDREITQRLIGAGKLLGIEVLDHLVVGDGRYVSFRERGLVEFS